MAVKRIKQHITQVIQQCIPKRKLQRLQLSSNCEKLKVNYVTVIKEVNVLIKVYI